MSSHHNFPVSHPNFFFNARFENDSGPWDEWEFKVDYVDENGLLRTATFSVGVLASVSGIPSICVDSCDVPDLTAEEFRAHVRMGSQACGDVPGTTEWATRFITGGETTYFQMACGAVRMESYSKPNADEIDITFKMGNNAPYRTVRFSLNELAREHYTFDPNKQWPILAGSIKAQFPNISHEHNSQLTQQEKDDIIAYVQGLGPMI